ncbi:MAG: DUF1294 domain-containing protein [Christensenellales bacterium]
MAQINAKARRGAWRISEKTLLTCTWLSAAWVALIGMRVFRHKTKHRAFTVSADCRGNQHRGRIVRRR